MIIKMTSGVYERVVRALSKAPKDRAVSEVDSLLPWFRKKSDLFTDMKTGMSNIEWFIICLGRVIIT